MTSIKLKWIRDMFYSHFIFQSNKSSHCGCMAESVPKKIVFEAEVWWTVLWTGSFKVQRRMLLAVFPAIYLKSLRLGRLRVKLNFSRSGRKTKRITGMFSYQHAYRPAHIVSATRMQVETVCKHVKMLLTVLQTAVSMIRAGSSSSAKNNYVSHLSRPSIVCLRWHLTILIIICSRRSVVVNPLAKLQTIHIHSFYNNLHFVLVHDASSVPCTHTHKKKWKEKNVRMK